MTVTKREESSERIIIDQIHLDSGLVNMFTKAKFVAFIVEICVSLFLRFLGSLCT